MSFVDAVVLPSSEMALLDVAAVLDFVEDTVAAVADCMATSRIGDKPVEVVVGGCNEIADRAVEVQGVLSVEHRIA
jgi:hypothetical protein